jgi:hypothetical protein
MTEESITQGLPDIKECIKLEKNTKGYNWEIKIFSCVEHLLPTDIKRLEELDLLMMERWGGK